MLQIASGASVSISSMPGPWKSLEGRGSKREITYVRAGGGEPQQPVGGAYTPNELKTVRYIDLPRDDQLLRDLDAERYDAYSPATITETAIDSAGVPIGGGTALAGCVLTGHEITGSDSSKTNDLRELTLTWQRKGA